MHLLYLDESGNESDPEDRFFALGGISLFERQTYFLAKTLDEIQHRHFPNTQPISFHASEIRSGRGFWRKVSDDVRTAVLTDISDAIAASPGHGRFLYAAVVEKSQALWGERAVERATEEICRRFDSFLGQQYHRKQSPERGLIIFSEGRFDARAKLWVREFHQRGTQWGAINNLADIPYFASMRESRLLQLADFVTHAVWLAFEREDDSLFAPLTRFFDTNRDGRLQGIVHVREKSTIACACVVCSAKKSTRPPKRRHAFFRRRK